MLATVSKIEETNKDIRCANASTAQQNSRYADISVPAGFPLGTGKPYKQFCIASKVIVYFFVYKCLVKYLSFCD